MKKIEDKTITSIFKNVMKGTVIILYFLIISLAYYRLGYEALQNVLKGFVVVILVLVIFALEKSYKKDDEYIFLEAVEYIVILIHSLTISYIVNKFEFDFRSYVIASSYIFAAYFIMKSIVIYTKAEKEYAKSLSDISEIVKKEEPQIKEATKKSKNEKVEDKKAEVKEAKPKSSKIGKASKTKTATKKTTTSKIAKTGTKKTTSKKVTEEKPVEKKKTTTKKKTTKKSTETKKTTIKKEPAKKEMPKKEEVKEND